MNRKHTTVLALGTLAGSLALSGSAFAVTPLAQGYMADGPQQAGQHGMKAMDSDGDGKLSKNEFAAAHDGKTDQFAAHDLDGDGFITQAEMDAAHAKMKDAGQRPPTTTDSKTDAKTDAKTDTKTGSKSAEGKCGEGKCGEGKCGSH